MTVTGNRTTEREIEIILSRVKVTDRRVPRKMRFASEQKPIKRLVNTAAKNRYSCKN
jgi:hypothetical protein